MQGSYLIPANSKRSMLILSLFAPIDLMIFGAGVGLTFLMLRVFGNAEKTINDIFFMLLPALIGGIMVVPVPNHRNIWQLTVHIYSFLMSNRQYCWKGWCFNDGSSKKQ